MYIIDKNIPLPPKTSWGRPRGSKYPFLQMEIGDSFFVPNQDNGKSSITSGTFYVTKKNPQYCFSRRHVQENGKDGVRIWRIAKDDE